MEVKIKKIWLFLLPISCLLFALTITSAEAANCGTTKSGKKCPTGYQVCGSGADIRCVADNYCDGNFNCNTCACPTTPVTTTPGLTPAYVNYDGNSGYLRIGGSIESGGGLLVSDTSNLNGDVNISGQLKISGGNPGAGKVLVSDASGLASWQTISISTSTPPVVPGTVPGLFDVLTQSADAKQFAGTIYFGTSVNPKRVANITDYGTMTALKFVANQANSTSSLSGNLLVKKNLSVTGKSVLGNLSANDITANTVTVGDSNTYWKAEIRDINGFKAPILSGKVIDEPASNSRGGILNGVVLVGDYGNSNNVKLAFTGFDNLDKEFAIVYDADNDYTWMGGGDNNQLVILNGGTTFGNGDVSLTGGYNGTPQKLIFGGLPDSDGNGGSGEYIYSNRNSSSTSYDYWNLIFSTGFVDSMTIATNGNVGIGSRFYTPSERLEIKDGSLLLGNNGGDWGLKIRDASQAPQMVLKVDAGNKTWLNGGDMINFTTNYGNDSVMKATERGIVITAGNGGINDQNSGYYFSDAKNTLHLWSQAGPNAGLTIQSLFDNRWDINHDRNSGRLYINHSNDSGTSTKNVLTLNNNGGLGVGTTNPTAGLDVIVSTGPIANLGGWATGNRAIAMIGGVGNGSRASGAYSFSAGASAVAEGDYSVALGGAYGSGTKASGNGAFAAGGMAGANGYGAVALGEGQVVGMRSFGFNATVNGNQSLGLGVQVGNGANITGDNSIVLGTGSVTGNNSIVIGQAMGNSAAVQGNGSVAFGVAKVVGNNSFAFGQGIGNGANVNAYGSILIGNGTLNQDNVTVISSNSGVVGINNFSPVESLDVKGNINASGAYKAGGQTGLTQTITVSGTCTLNVKGGIIISTTCNQQ